MMTKLRVLGALTAGLMAATAPAAQAESLAHVDAQGDVWTLDPNVSEDEGWEPSTHQTNVDLAATGVAHKKRAVVLRARFVDLRRNQDEFTLGMNLKDERGRLFAAGVAVTPDRRQGELFVERGRGAASFRCGGATRTVDYAADRVVVRVPRKCLGTPRWFRVQVAAVSASESTGGFFFDDAHSEGAVWDGWSPRIRRA